MASVMTTAGQAWLRADPSRWTSATLRVRLVEDDETGIDAALTAMTGVGLPASDAALSGRAVTYDASTRRLLFSADATTTPPVTGGVINRAVVFAFDTDDAGSLPLFVTDVPAQAAVGLQFVIDWDNEGVIWVTLDPEEVDEGDYPPATYSRDSGLTSALTSAASSMVPRDETGDPDAGGYMVVLGLGMSSAKTHWAALKLHVRDATYAHAFHPRLVYQNAADSGYVADNWANPADGCWTQAVSKVGSNYIGCEPEQVLHIHLMVTQSWPAEEGWRDGSTVDPIGYMTESQLEQIVANAKANFPNLVSMDLHSHAWTGLSTSGQAPVASIHSDDALLASFAGTHSGVLVDYVQVYADGATYNAQHTTTDYPSGIRWLSEDFVTDNIHPSTTGVAKMVGYILSRWYEDATKAWMWD